MQHHLPTLAGLVMAVSAIVFHIGAVDAADPAATATPGYAKERADCEAGRTAQDRATCLKEAGAAAAEKKRNTLDNAGSPRANASDRCNALPAKDKADCLARIDGPAANQQTRTSGSVAGGGVIKETTTTTVGPAVVIPVPAAPASAPR